MKVKNDNSAGRLYEILSAAKMQGANAPVINMWRKVFGIKENSSNLEVFRTLVSLKELVFEVKETVSMNDSMNKELFLSRYARIENATESLNLSATWGNSRDLLDDATMLSLAHIAEEFSKNNKEKSIDDAELADIESEIGKLVEDIQASNVTADFKIILLDQIFAIQRSIQEYRLRGAKGIKKALEQFYGAFIINHKLFVEKKDNSIVKSTISLVWKVTQVVSTAFKATEIAHESVVKLLETVKKL